MCCNKVNKWITMCFTDSKIGHFHTFNLNYNTFLLFNPWLLPFHISIFFWKRKQIKLNKISLSHLAPLPTEYYNTWFKKTGQTRYSNCASFYQLGVPYLLIHHHSQSLTFGEPSSCDAFYWIEEYKWNKLESNLVK